MTHEQGPVDGDQPRAPGESVNETTAEGREEGSAAKEKKNGGPVPGEPALPAKPPRPSSGGGQPGNVLHLYLIFFQLQLLVDDLLIDFYSVVGRQ